MAFTLEMRRKSAETRARHKAEREAGRMRDAAQSSSGTFSGVGESKRFVAPEGSIDREVDISQCHLNGKLIADLGFTPEQITLIPFRNTDEGTAAFANEPPKTEFERRLRTYEPTRGDENDGTNWEAPDLLKDTAAPFARPGFAQRFLGEKRCDQAGLRKWSPVKDSRGNLVRVGRSLFLGEMPEELAAKRRAAIKADTDAQQREIGENMQVQQERFIREGGLPLKPSEILRTPASPTGAVVEGLHIRRGNTTE